MAYSSDMIIICICVSFISPISGENRWYDLTNFFDTAFEQTSTTKQITISTTTRIPEEFLITIKNDATIKAPKYLALISHEQDFCNESKKIDRNVQKLEEKIQKIVSTISSIKNEMVDEIKKQKSQDYQNYVDVFETSDEEKKIKVDTKCLNAEHAAQLNEVYEELISNYKAEIEELKKKVKLNSGTCAENSKQFIQNEENLTLESTTKSSNWRRPTSTSTTKPFRIFRATTQATSTTKSNPYASFWLPLASRGSKTETSTINVPPHYKWVEFSKTRNFPANAVVGGQDIEGSTLYVAQGTDPRYSDLYGKLVSPGLDAFLTDQTHEFYVTSVQILTAPSYTWQKFNISYENSNPSNSFPICRARHLNLYIPGTITGRKCRIGFGLKIHHYDDFETLSIVL